jgi:hypothetical protein
VGAVEEAKQVDVEHLPPLLGVGAVDRAKQHHAGVVDEHVDSAEALVRGGDECVRRPLVGHVDLEGDRATAGRADPLGQRLDPV